ncbi:MAG: hypothetical protein RBT62_07355 [Spirochaetia bacterium]|nr:hypothetical protein [Spirochaetia bacterium]
MRDDASTVSMLFAWPSSGKRKILLESIAGHAENLRHYGRLLPLLLALDGRRIDLDPEVNSGLEKLCQRYPQQLQIVDEISRQAFLESLPHDIDGTSASFALVPSLDDGFSSRGPGRNRNMMLLAAAGGLLLASDDDILCTPATNKNKGSFGLEYSSELFPLPLRFYADRAALLAEITKGECDIVTEHQRYLGHNASEFFNNDAPAAQGKIVLSCAGCYGDSGLGRARTVLGLKDTMRSHMLKSGYEQTRYSREVTRIPDRVLIGPSMVFMTGHSGYDVREYLPPFFPLGGNEDGFFAMLVRVCSPGSLTVFPSFGLFHDPPEQRPYSRESLVGFKPNSTELLMALTLACLPDRSLSDTRSRMIQLGKNYVDISLVSNSDFVEIMHQCWSQGAMAYVEDLRMLLDTHDRQPILWASDIDELLENIYMLMREPHTLFGPNGCGLKVEQVKALLLKYGRLLEVWPDMLDFAANNKT